METKPTYKINLAIIPGRIINISFPGFTGGILVDTTQAAPLVTVNNGTEEFIFPELPAAPVDPNGGAKCQLR
jgi:hypothetical protein